jgi:hypothetical protein
MKKIVFVFAFLFTAAMVSAQEVMSIESAPEDYKLTDAQYATWKTISTNWLSDDFEKIKFENKIDVNCKSCSSVYMDVIIKINASGKLEYYKLVKGKKCGLELTKQFELRMMRSFFKFEYPPELRNVVFKTRLGTILKC